MVASIRWNRKEDREIAGERDQSSKTEQSRERVDRQDRQDGVKRRKADETRRQIVETLGKPAQLYRVIGHVSAWAAVAQAQPDRSERRPASRV